MTDSNRGAGGAIPGAGRLAQNLRISLLSARQLREIVEDNDSVAPGALPANGIPFSGREKSCAMVEALIHAEYKRLLDRRLRAAQQPADK